jgi:hypothetical protein
MSAVDEVTLALRLPAPARIDGVARWIGAVRDRAARIDAGGLAFVVVSPIGLAERARLAVALRALGVRVQRRVRLPCWSRIATAIRVARGAPSRPRLGLAALFEEAWEALAPGGEGEAWAIAADGDHARIARAKRAVRDPMRALRVDFGIRGLEPRILTPFHLADGDDAQAEARRVLAAVELLGARAGERAQARRR